MHCKNCTTVKNKTKNKNKEIKQNKPKQKKHFISLDIS